jgi:hypothetical protein
VKVLLIIIVHCDKVVILNLNVPIVKRRKSEIFRKNICWGAIENCAFFLNVCKNELTIVGLVF